MSDISNDPKTYRRLEQFSQRTRVSIHAAASDAIENWLDVSSDPGLAIAALSTIATTPPDPLPGPGSLAPEALPTNVVYINASLGLSSHHQDESVRKLHGAGTNGVAQ